MIREVRTALQATFALIVWATALSAQPAPITGIPAGSGNFFAMGDMVFFTSQDSLFRSDGTAEGTIFLKKVRAQNFREFNGSLYFTSHGTELWRSDGTPSGTFRLATYNAVSFIEDVGDYLYFAASTDAYGNELHRTNGLPDGTILLKDINPGPADGIGRDRYPFLNSFGSQFAAVSNHLFFPAQDGTHGFEPWKTDGSPEGTLMVKDINPGAEDGFGPGGAGSFNNQFYFPGINSPDGADPWISDGTPEGTRLLKDVTSEADRYRIIDFAATFNGSLYFSVYHDAAFSFELWKTDGPSTTKIKTLCDGDCRFDSRFLNFKGNAYFFVYQEYGEYRLWSTDGTTQETELIYSQFIDGNIEFFDVVGDYILFYSTYQGNATEFYRSDGTSGGTKPFTTFQSGGPSGNKPIAMAKVGDLVFYADHDGPHSGYGIAENPEEAYELMQTDGISVQPLKDIYGLSLNGTVNIIDFNGKVLFARRDPERANSPKELWIYDPNQQVGSFTLVNADTDEDIQTLANGNVIIKPANMNFNIRYNPVNKPGSVVFKHREKIVRRENSPPYSLAGDYSGDYLPWTNANAGEHSISATPYSESGGNGIAGPTLMVHFTIQEADDECTASGTILREYWGNVPGPTVSDIPVDEPPTSTNQLTTFEGPQNIGTNYATRIRGYICPPSTGSYTLWIASNDHSELWLSTDDNPANKQRIAYLTRAVDPRQWDRFATQRSAPVTLERGKRYYVEALHKQGVGTDHIAVGWELPDGTLERPMSGEHLSPFEANLSSIAAETAHDRSRQSSSYSEINVFPNPARSGASSLILAGYGEFEETVDTNIKIINMTGEVIYADKFSCGGECEAYPLNPDHMTPGLYMVEMEMNGTRHSRRLVVK